MTASEVVRQLCAQALDWSIENPAPTVAAMQELARLGDFTILPELQVMKANLVWDGPAADGMEHMAYFFEAYRDAVDAMAAQAEAASRCKP